MEVFILRGLVLIIVTLFNIKCFVNSKPTLAELTLAQELLFEDVNSIKRKVWVEMTSRMNSFEAKLQEIQNLDMCERLCENQQGNNSRKSENVKSSTINIVNDNSRYELLLRGLRDEKARSMRLENRLNSALDTIKTMGNKLNDYESVVTSLSNAVSQLEQELTDVKADTEINRNKVFTLQKSHKDIVHTITPINGSFHDNRAKTNSTIGKPSFVSDWILMRAQDSQLAHKTVPHGVGALPYKVDVQIRPTSGPNAGWIFSGDSAFQSDDDIKGEVYGGVVYFYDDQNVYLSAPRKGNDYDLGVIVNTGETNNRRIGNHHQTAKEAYVRVRAWAPSDMPEPDIVSNWLPVDISNQTLTYYQIEHSLKGYPGLVNVQIRCMLKDDKLLISEGIGATVPPKTWSSAGGVVYAFNESLVRVWTGYNSDITEKSNSYYRLLGTRDGWGFPVSQDCMKGHVRIMAWGRNKVSGKSGEFERHEKNNQFTEWLAFEKFSTEFDLFSFYVQADDGVNQGFIFPGYGSSQATLSPFGGVVYAYNSNGDVRIWRPNPSAKGSLIYVHTGYGNGVNTQTSNDAHYVSTLLRAK